MPVKTCAVEPSCLTNFMRVKRHVVESFAVELHACQTSCLSNYVPLHCIPGNLHDAKLVGLVQCLCLTWHRIYIGLGRA
jgi:hypothetical protein